MLGVTSGKLISCCYLVLFYGAAFLLLPVAVLDVLGTSSWPPIITMSIVVFFDFLDNPDTNEPCDYLPVA